jgi:hypothetical protein
MKSSSRAKGSMKAAWETVVSRVVLLLGAYHDEALGGRHALEKDRDDPPADRIDSIDSGSGSEQTAMKDSTAPDASAI